MIDLPMDPYAIGGFSLFGAMFVLIPALIIGVFIFIFVKGITEWSSNNQSPILNVPAEVMTKRTRTSGGHGDSAANTSYYVTFEVQSGDRIELRVNGSEFGMLAEQDLGILTFQGTRYKGFDRDKNKLV